jgi:hypothetical protein
MIYVKRTIVPETAFIQNPGQQRACKSITLRCVLSRSIAYLVRPG